MARRVAGWKATRNSKLNRQCGFYKRRLVKDGSWLPIAFWRNVDDQIVCCFEGKLVDPIAHWTFAAKYPVSEMAYRHYIRAGHWPDESTGSPSLEHAKRSLRGADARSSGQA